jgi:hypothetical protein
VSSCLSSISLINERTCFDLQPGSASLFAVCAMAMRQKARIPAALANQLAVLSVHLTARSASGVQNCTFGLQRVLQDSADD